MATQRRLKLCLIGLGRLGALRARILAFEQPRIELVAVCDTKPGADKWAATNLPPSVKFYPTPEECMKNSGAQAVLISTATATHAALICLALDLDLVCHLPRARDAGPFTFTNADDHVACHVREAHISGHHHHQGGRGQICL